MIKLQVLLLFACYEISSTIWLPITKYRRTKATHPPLLPSELTEDQLYRLKIPNKRLCDEMEGQEGKYLLIPWLSQNCQDLKDDVAKKLSPGDVLPIHKAVISKLHSYRRNGLLKYNIRTHRPRNIAILLHLSNVYPKKKYKVRSSESIENILYYKDCNHKKQAEPTLLRSPPQQPECKMCCTMCCGDQCVNNNQLMMGSQAQGVNVEPKMQPILPNIPSRERRKKISPIDQMPQPKRRGLSFTRENIKSLISKDDDIRKILKDLVRVTMQKVDLMELINSRRNLQTNTEPPPDSANSENDL